jgi:hypothetical protein
MSRLKTISTTKVQLKNDQERNNINLKYSQNSQNDYSIKSALAGQLYDVLVDEGLCYSQTPLAINREANSFLLELEVDENDMVRVWLLGRKR